jgi:hypothetical protein
VVSGLHFSILSLHSHFNYRLHSKITEDQFATSRKELKANAKVQEKAKKAKVLLPPSYQYTYYHLPSLHASLFHTSYALATQADR